MVLPKGETTKRPPGTRLALVGPPRLVERRHGEGPVGVEGGHGRVGLVVVEGGRSREGDGEGPGGGQGLPVVVLTRTPSIKWV